jgi:hypothetical protein
VRGSTRDDRLALLSLAAAGSATAQAEVAAGVRRHLGGQHDQKSHGRKGGGPTWEGSPDGLTFTMTGPGETRIRAAFNSTDSPEIRQGILDGISDARRFADVPEGTDVFVKTSGSGIPGLTVDGIIFVGGESKIGWTIEVSRDLGDPDSDLYKGVLRDSQSGFHFRPPEESPSGIVRLVTAHEFGHVVAGAGGDTGRADVARGFARDVRARYVAMKDPYAGVHLMDEFTSGYGQRSPDEAFADAYAGSVYGTVKPKVAKAVLAAIAGDSSRHLGGQHDQKAHGRKGGSGPASSALSQPQQAWAAAEGWTNMTPQGVALYGLGFKDKASLARVEDLDQPTALANLYAAERQAGRLDGGMVYRDADGREIVVLFPKDTDRAMKEGVVSGIDRGRAVADIPKNTRVGLSVSSALSEGVCGRTTASEAGDIRVSVNRDLSRSGTYTHDGSAEAHANGFHYPLRSKTSAGLVEATVAHEWAHAVDKSSGQQGTGVGSDLNAVFRNPTGWPMTAEFTRTPASYVSTGYGQRSPVEAFADAFSAVAMGTAPAEVEEGVRQALASPDIVRRNRMLLLALALGGDLAARSAVLAGVRRHMTGLHDQKKHGRPQGGGAKGSKQSAAKQMLDRMRDRVTQFAQTQAARIYGPVDGGFEGEALDHALKRKAARDLADDMERQGKGDDLIKAAIEREYVDRDVTLRDDLPQITYPKDAGYADAAVYEWGPNGNLNVWSVADVSFDAYAAIERGAGAKEIASILARETGKWPESTFALAGTPAGRKVLLDAAASGMIREWAGSTYTNGARSMMAAAERTLIPDDWGQSYTYTPPDRLIGDDDFWDGVVRSQYDRTQEFLRESGIEGEITLYRGVHGDFPSDGADRVAHLRPLSSFSTNPEMAQSFANGSDGRVITARVPVEQIFSVPGIGIGCLRESEVVVLGPQVRAIFDAQLDFDELYGEGLRATWLTMDNYEVIIDDGDNADWLRSVEEAKRHQPGQHDQKSHGRKGAGGDSGSPEYAGDALISAASVAQQGTYSAVYLEPEVWGPGNDFGYKPGVWHKTTDDYGEVLVNGGLRVHFDPTIPKDKQVEMLRDVDLLARNPNGQKYGVSPYGGLMAEAPGRVDFAPLLHVDDKPRLAMADDTGIVYNSRLWTEESAGRRLRDAFDPSSEYGHDFEAFNGDFEGPTVRSARIYGMVLAESYRQEQRNGGGGENLLKERYAEAGDPDTTMVGMMGPPASAWAQQGPGQWYSEMEAGSMTEEILDAAFKRGEIGEEDTWAMTDDQQEWREAFG